MKFLYNLAITMMINVIVALIFAKALDNVKNPFLIFAFLSLVSAVVVTLLQYKQSEQTVE